MHFFFFDKRSCLFAFYMNLHFCFCIKQMMRVTYRQIVFFRRRPKTGILMAEVTRWWGQRSFFCSFLPNVNTLLFLLPSFTKVANWASKYATSPPLLTLLPRLQKSWINQSSTVLWKWFDDAKSHDQLQFLLDPNYQVDWVMFWNVISLKKILAAVEKSNTFYDYTFRDDRTPLLAFFWAIFHGVMIIP